MDDGPKKENPVQTGRLRYAAEMGCLAIAYFVTAKLGLMMDAVGGFATLVWPPTGIALAALLIFGSRLWPAIAMAAFLVNLSSGAPFASACGMALGNTMEAMVGAALLRRHGFDPSFSRLHQVANFVIFGVISSTAISATIGVLSLWFGGILQAPALRASWTAWWLGDMLGALVVAPLLLVWNEQRRISFRMDRKRLAETVAFVLLLVVVGHTIVDFSPGSPLKPYLAFPILIWVALRFGVRGTTTATLAISVVAIWATAEGIGPFALSHLSDGLRTVHFFLGSLAITGLTLAAAVAERTRAERAARESEARVAAERRIRSIVQASNDAFVVMDDKGLITDWNTQAEATFGWPAAEAIGRSLSETIIPPRYREAHCRGLAHFLKTGNGAVLARRIEMTAFRRDGSEFPVEFTINPISVGGSYVFSAFLRDITERKRADQLQIIQLAATRIVAEAGTRSEVFGKSLEAICRGIGWDYGAIWVGDASGEKLVCGDVRHRQTRELQEFERASREISFGPGEGFPGRVWLSRDAICAADATVDSRFWRAPHAKAAGLHGAMLFPIVADDRCVGVVEFFSHEQRKSDPKLLEVMTDIGARLGFYILRVNAEELREQSEDRYRQIVDAVQDYAIFALDPDGNISSWNAGAARITGYQTDEIIGRHFSVFCTADATGRDHSAFELATARATGQFEEEGIRIRKDGSKYWANVVITPIVDRAHNVIGFSKVTRDITARKEAAERERQISELEFRAVFDHASAGAAQADPATGRFIRVNPKYCEITGYSAEELLGMSFYDVTHPADRDDTVQRFTKLVIGEVPEFLAEKRYLRKDGSIVWVQVTVTVIRDGSGDALRAVAIVQDVSERKVAEAEQRFLADAAKVLATLDYQTNLTNLAHLTVPKLADWCSVDILDENGHVKRLAVAHVDPEKVKLARELEERYPTDPASPYGVFEVIRTGRPELYSEISDDLLKSSARDETHLRMLRDTGMRSAMTVPLEHRGKVLGALTMVAAESGRRYSRRDLEFAVEVGRRAAMAIDNARIYAASINTNRLKDEFLATLSHELRTPLNSILGWADLLCNGDIPADEIAEANETIWRNAHTQSQLINDLLDVSRIITGKLRIEPRPVDIQVVVANAIASVRLSAQAKGVRLLLSSESSVGTIQGDTDRLQQVLWNLLTNAIRFTPKNGSIDLALRRVDSKVEIVVADSGDGIDLTFLPHVFDRFRQEDSSRTRRHGGLGLGLAIVRHIVEAHGGTVRAASPGRGQGATFTVSLPDAQAALGIEPRASLTTEAITTKGRSREPSPQDLVGLQILVIDDDDGSRRMVRKILINHGAEVIEATSAAEALQMAGDYKPNVIISDIGMPEVDGYELMRRIRALPEKAIAEIPSIALTAYARDEERQEALDAGFLAHVSKPVRAKQLVSCIARVAGR